jgi:rod shape-determining protein MreC
MPDSLLHVAAALILLLALIFLNVVGVISPIIDWGRLSVEVLAFPIAKFFEVVDGSSFVLSSVKTLSTQNQILADQVKELSAEVAGLMQARSENEELRKALDFSQSTSLPLISAEVITADPLRGGQTIIVDRGKNQGVAEGDPVVVAGAVLVGVIQNAFDNTSIVELVSSSGVSINAQTPSGRATGILRGEHGLGLLLDLVSQNETISAGDKIITSGTGSRFPKNLLIGEVSEVSSASSDLFQKATVIPSADLKNLRFVFVVDIEP